MLLEPVEEASGDDLLDQLLEVDATVYLPGDLLAKIDIATMAYSLEARSPLLDHEFMELAASIPRRPQGERRAAQDRPQGRSARLASRWRSSTGRKQGFELPVARWLRTDLAPFTREILLDQQSVERGWIRPEEVASMIDEHVAGTVDHGRRLWSLLTLELWAQSAISAEAELAPAVA